jgi:ketosteroid isomerase-like protein
MLRLSKTSSILVLILSSCVNVLIAQKQSRVQDVIDAENAFAKLSRDENTRAAFLENFAPTGVVVARGEIINAIERWGATPADSALLNWRPVYADISIDGDLGYTTGPFEYFKDRKDSQAIGFGYYSTVWKKQSDGKWKVAIDLGISLRQSDSIATTVNVPKVKGTKSSSVTSKADFISMEEAYLKVLNETSTSFRPEFLAEEFRLHRPNIVPVNKKDNLSLLNEAQRKFTFEHVFSEISTSGDLAYSYGNVTIEITRDNVPKTIPANYMRVWKRIDQKWQIVLDVISLG